MLTGCRLGEVLALRWGDIDYDKGAPGPLVNPRETRKHDRTKERN